MLRLLPENSYKQQIIAVLLIVPSVFSYSSCSCLGQLVLWDVLHRCVCMNVNACMRYICVLTRFSTELPVLWLESDHRWRRHQEREDVQPVWAHPQAAAEVLHRVDVAAVSHAAGCTACRPSCPSHSHSCVSSARQRFPKWFKLSFTPSRRMSLLNKYLKQLFEGPCKGVSSCFSLLVDSLNDANPPHSHANSIFFFAEWVCLQLVPGWTQRCWRDIGDR